MSSIIPNRDRDGNHVVYMAPYSSKSNNTHKFFKRIHGTKENCTSGQVTNIDFVIPYNNVKIYKFELIGTQEGDTCNLKFYDTPTGTISGVNNYMLNQFAYNVSLPGAEVYTNSSQYDADAIKDMKVRVEYTNNGTTKDISFNIHMDELVVI